MEDKDKVQEILDDREAKKEEDKKPEINAPDKIPDHLKHLFERRIPKPHYIRVRDFVRMPGMNYIVRRNEHGQIVYIVGKAHRKLSTKIEVDHALKMGKNVGQWGNKFFLFSRMDAEEARLLLPDLWAADERRGIPRPEVSDYDKDSFNI